MRFLLILTLAIQMLGLALANEFFPQYKYDNWAADLKPGFIIQQRSSCPRCYCKVPIPLNTTTSTTSTSTTTSTTTTSIPTTTSTSTTSTTSTPTTTSTSTTSTSSTSTTTSSSTSTTTTGTTTTTDKNEYWSGNCSLSLTMSDDMTAYWQSPLYDGGTTNYPEGDYCCSCNITIPASYKIFVANMEMATPSSIHDNLRCEGDRITFTSSSGSTVKLCGSLASKTWSELQIHNGPHAFSFEWCSDTTDGGTDIGFKMTITGHNVSGRK